MRGDGGFLVNIETDPDQSFCSGTRSALGGSGLSSPATVHRCVLPTQNRPHAATPILEVTRRGPRKMHPPAPESPAGQLQELAVGPSVPTRPARVTVPSVVGPHMPGTDAAPVAGRLAPPQHCRGGTRGASPLEAGSGGRGLKQSERGKQPGEQRSKSCKALPALLCPVPHTTPPHPGGRLWD